MVISVINLCPKLDIKTKETKQLKKKNRDCGKVLKQREDSGTL